ncbi:hypothetical protein VCRA2122O12_290006 [Vibrio crassostreae]|nr:hypothetical protein VCRA2114E5_230028 [Vibrio crassostreae]CAK1923199.1 hypothetical protein VCRA2110O1_260028 [Vibrio crassostreae]CAK1958714.1 hypothetical protein VCRA2110O4_290048 [Vibrio crassostreae]CAK2685184.1 hypothetical protein VCRA2110O3_220027 [Vibrio crassostreae]CAK2745004.1 hypothetical protein VCRA2110O2_280006 [Vibrio crassostreae]
MKLIKIKSKIDQLASGGLVLIYTDGFNKKNLDFAVFFKVVVIICLLIKLLLFLGSDERHQQAQSS